MEGLLILLLLIGFLFFFVLAWDGILTGMIESLFRFFGDSMTPTFHLHKWEYGSIKVPVEDRWGRDIPDITMPHRVCKDCGQKQYRTMRPTMNGVFDDNTWNNYDGELKLKS